ncbi:uncharacterized protein LOC144349279 [Saccoglossus kowalevskii]
MDGMKSDITHSNIQEVFHESYSDQYSSLALHTLALGRMIATLNKDSISNLLNTNSLFTSVGSYLRRFGDLTNARFLYDLMARLSKMHEPVNKKELEEELRYLGKVNLELCEFERAEEVLTECLEISKEAYGKDDIVVAYGMQNLGRAMQNQCKYMTNKRQRKKVKQLLLKTLRLKHLPIGNNTNACFTIACVLNYYTSLRWSTLVYAGLH